MKVRQPIEMLEDQLLVTHLAGSKAYGTNLPTSDTDIRGIFVADELYHRSPWYTVNEIEIPEDEDTKYYELSKFLKLLVDQNPNIVESLWVDEDDILTSSPGYELLRANREQLLSSKVAFTFSGYAVSQLKRIKGHNKWINNPQPEERPKQYEFMSLIQSLTEDKELKYTTEDIVRDQKTYSLLHYGNDVFGMYLRPSPGSPWVFDDSGALVTNTPREQVSGQPVRIIKFNRDEYKLAKEKHKQYWDWKTNRNESRSELEEKFGYDTKHAMHLVRLLRMAEEVLSEGIIRVKRPDAQELLSIRDGAWTYEELVSYAEEVDNRIRNELYKSTKLRKTVDVKFASKLLMEVQELAWGKQ